MGVGVWLCNSLSVSLYMCVHSVCVHFTVCTNASVLELACRYRSNCRHRYIRGGSNPHSLAAIA